MARPVRKGQFQAVFSSGSKCTIIVFESSNRPTGWSLSKSEMEESWTFRTELGHPVTFVNNGMYRIQVGKQSVLVTTDDPDAPTITPDQPNSAASVFLLAVMFFCLFFLPLYWAFDALLHLISNKKANTEIDLSMQMQIFIGVVYWGVTALIIVRYAMKEGARGRARRQLMSVVNVLIAILISVIVCGVFVAVRILLK